MGEGSPRVPATAMILAAGRGERLRPLSDHLPKPLVDVGGIPLIGHTLATLAGLGVRRVVINVWHLADQVTAVVGDGGAYGLEVAWSREERLMDTGGGIRLALPLLGADPVLLVNGDLLWNLDLAPLLGGFDPARMDALLGLVPTPEYKRGDFRRLEDGTLIRSPQGFTYAGIQILQAGALLPWPPEPFSLNRFFDVAADAGRLHGVVLGGEWDDLGTLERLHRARQNWRPALRPTG